jgi:release factor glutamine methyltransferase
MNQLIADNKVSTLRAYLVNKLCTLYESREANQIAQLLFEEFNGWKRSEVVLHLDHRLGESELLRYHFALKKILLGEPVQYVLGHTWFMGLKLKTTPAALIPRPETEELVQWALELNKIHEPRILDIGTGSGCVAIALKKGIPGAHVYALDVSESALQLAQENATLNTTEISFSRLDILHETPMGSYDIVVSNPPYIPQSESSSMHQRVTDYEPSIALFTDDDQALIFYERFMHLTPNLLNSGGIVICEIHENMEDSLMELATKYSISMPLIRHDMQGKPRMISWTNNSSNQ